MSLAAIAMAACEGTNKGMTSATLPTNENPREPYKSHKATYGIPGGDMIVTTEWWGPSDYEGINGVHDWDVIDNTASGLVMTQRTSYRGAFYRPTSVSVSPLAPLHDGLLGG